MSRQPIPTPWVLPREEMTYAFSIQLRMAEDIAAAFRDGTPPEFPVNQLLHDGWSMERIIRYSDQASTTAGRMLNEEATREALYRKIASLEAKLTATREELRQMRAQDCSARPHKACTLNPAPTEESA